MALHKSFIDSLKETNQCTIFEGMISGFLLCGAQRMSCLRAQRNYIDAIKGGTTILKVGGGSMHWKVGGSIQ